MDGMPDTSAAPPRAAFPGTAPEEAPDLAVYEAAAELGTALAAAARSGAGAGLRFRVGGYFQWAPVWTAEVKTHTVAVPHGGPEPGSRRRPRPFLDAATVLVRPFELPWHRLGDPVSATPGAPAIGNENSVAARRLSLAFNALAAFRVRVAVKMAHGWVAVISERPIACLQEASGQFLVAPDESNGACPWHVGSGHTVDA